MNQREYFLLRLTSQRLSSLRVKSRTGPRVGLWLEASSPLQPQAYPPSSLSLFLGALPKEEFLSPFTCAVDLLLLERSAQLSGSM